jgi:hypothetical protein
LGAETAAVFVLGSSAFFGCWGATLTVALLPFTVTLTAVTAFFGATDLTATGFFAFGAVFVLIVFAILSSVRNAENSAIPSGYKFRFCIFIKAMRLKKIEIGTYVDYNGNIIEIQAFIKKSLTNILLYENQ